MRYGLQTMLIVMLTASLVHADGASPPSAKQLASPAWWIEQANAELTKVKDAPAKRALAASLAYLAVNTGMHEPVVAAIANRQLEPQDEAELLTEMLERWERAESIDAANALADDLGNRYERMIVAMRARRLAREGKAEKAYDEVPAEHRDVSMLVDLAETAAATGHPDQAMKLAEFASAAHERQSSAGRYNNSVCRGFLAAALAVSKVEDRTDDVAAWFTLAIKAIEDLPEEMQVAPRIWVAEALAQAGDHEQAVQMADLIKDADTKSECLRLVAAQQWQRGDADAAKQTTRQIEADLPLAWAVIEEAEYHARRKDKAAAMIAIGRAATVLRRVDQEQTTRGWSAGAAWARVIELEAELGEAQAAVKRIQSLANAQRIWLLLTELTERRALVGDVNFVRAATELVKEEDKQHWRARVLISAEIAAGHLQAVEASLAKLQNPNDLCLYLMRLARAHAGRRAEAEVARLVGLSSTALANVTSEYVGREALTELTWLQAWLAAPGREENAIKVWESIQRISDPATRVEMLISAADGTAQRLADEQPKQ